MPHRSNRWAFAGLSLLLVFLAWNGSGQTLESPAAAAGRLPPITNLLQLTHVVDAGGRVYRNVQLDVLVCAVSKPKVGVIIARDHTGVELLELGDLGREIHPGEKVHIECDRALLRKRAMGVELSAAPVIDNDGVHNPIATNGAIALKKGRVPIRLEWFKCLQQLALEVNYQPPRGSLEPVPNSALSHPVAEQSSGGTNVIPGLLGECYEGYWTALPEFDLLRPVKTGVVSNFDVNFRTHDQMVGLRFSGFFDAPEDGIYNFNVRSDDGSLLFLGNWQVPVTPTGLGDVPPAEAAVIGETVGNLDERRWITVQGRVTFVSEKGEGLEFEVHSDRESISVRLADAEGIDPVKLLDSYVHVTGVGQGVLGSDRRIVLGRLMVASGKEMRVRESNNGRGKLPSPLTTARQVQSLMIEDAQRELPVRLRGVVTSANAYYDHWISIQDETRGIFVRMRYVTNSFPAVGESWEIIGHTAAGDFAPIVFADKVTHLGPGRMPEPVHPTWNELVNGSMDVQWAEFEGLVTDVVNSNTISMILPEGRLNVQMEGYLESDLKQFVKTGVRIRGALYAVWDASTHEVRVGNLLMRNASIDVEQPAPHDPFDAPVKKPRDLFLFDVQHATPFQRVKVLGEIIHAEPDRLFLIQDGVGMRISPVQTVDFRPGDVVEAAGYPEISGPSPVLHEAVVRKTGYALLPAPRDIADSNLMSEGLDSTLIRVEANLVGWHTEQNALVLDMQSKTHLFVARLANRASELSLRAGSQLALTGVYVGQRDRLSAAQNQSFELLLNSPSNVTVLREPSWWTLRRLLSVVGLLVVVLVLAAAWITQLRRQVTQRTLQLQQEIRERERIERQHALEAERSRIARDLHDDLGSSLTEISVLASTGRHSTEVNPDQPGLFRAIADKAHGLISALDVIVWAVDPEENSLQSLADYLNSFVSEYLANSGISCRFKIPVSVPSAMLEGRVRHDLLLAVKETLNNIVRHARASEVEFRLAITEGSLEIVIVDNGAGFDVATAKAGYGLDSLSARLKKLGGSYTIRSHSGAGTTVIISLPIAVKT